MKTRRDLIVSMGSMAALPILGGGAAHAQNYVSAVNGLRRDLPQIFPSDFKFSSDNNAVEKFSRILIRST